MVIKKQKGASIFIALVFLIVLTLLAVSSMRGVVLDNKVSSGFVTDSKLFNQAETNLANIENEVGQYLSHLSICPSEGLPSDQKLCIKPNLKNKLEVEDDEMLEHSGAEINNIKSGWYMMPVHAPGLNPEYSQNLRGIGTYMYETTVKSEVETNSNEYIYIRAVYTKYFGG